MRRADGDRGSVGNGLSRSFDRFHAGSFPRSGVETRLRDAPAPCSGRQPVVLPTFPAYPGCTRTKIHPTPFSP